MLVLLKRLTFILLFILPSVVCFGKDGSISFKQLKKEFDNPSPEYRSAPLWVWNTKVTHTEIDRMLLELKEAGFGGAFVHPRPGLITEYLSDDWFELYQYSVEVGKKLGMDIWIYDENSYPSGFAGGHVPAQMPESYNQGQGLVMEQLSKLPDNMANYAYCLKKDGKTFVDITATAHLFKNKPGDYYLFKKTYYGRSNWHGGYTYVDILAKGVTQKFIDVTMSGYEKTFKNELGPVVKGIFTDEPNIASSGGIRWTPDLFDVFQKQWGYDLKASLPSLFEEVGEWKQVRHNYLETLLQLFIDRWAKPWSTYCKDKGMTWTGHYWEHGWPDMGHGADNMAMYAWHQMPGIDMLFNQFNEQDPQAQFGNVRAVKELRSVANQMGYKRTLSETYGGAGWEFTFEEMKRLGDWEYVLGVNFMNQHLAHMTLEGSRKYDYPPVFTYHSPWWSQYKHLNDYYARLSYVLSEGEQINDILVLEPTSTAWLYYSYHRSNEKLMQLGNNFQHFVTVLEKSQVEHDLGSENIIKDRGSVKNGLFVIGKREYKKVVIPPLTENINKPTFLLLKDYVAAGGKVVAFSTPILMDGKENKELIDFIRSNKNIEYIPDFTQEAINSHLASNEIQFTNVTGNSLYHQRRKYNDGEVLFLVNSSMDETISGEITVQGNTILQLDAFTSNIYSYPSLIQGKNMAAHFTLPPAGSLLLYYSEAVKNNYKQKIETPKTKIVNAQSPMQTKRIKDNALMIDFCDLVVNQDQYKGLHFADAAFKYFNHAGFSGGDPWTVSIQYRKKIVERDTLTTGNATASYSFYVNEGVDKNNIKLVTEKPGLWHVKVNGHTVSANKGEWWLDKHFGVYSIGNLVVEGDNVVDMSISPLSIYAEIEPIYIVGNFSVNATKTGWSIEKPIAELSKGSWKQQGLPFYSWDILYTKNYKITDVSAGYAVRLPAWSGTVAEVRVNGKPVGVIAFKPYELDVSTYLKKGENKIEVKVTGSLKNLLGPHHNNPGKGVSGPWHWKNIYGPVPGENYQMLDYGLMDDFELVSNK